MLATSSGDLKSIWTLTLVAVWFPSRYSSSQIYEIIEKNFNDTRCKEKNREKKEKEEVEKKEREP